MMKKTCLTIFALCGLAGCAMLPQKVQFTPFTEAVYPSKPEGAPIQLFKASVPQRPYVELGAIDVRGPEITSVVPGVRGVNYSLEAMKKEARKRGGDAIVSFYEESGEGYTFLRGVLVKWG